MLRVSAGPSAVLASTPSSTRTPRSRRPPRPRTLVRCFADGRCAAARRSQLHASLHGTWHPDGAFCLHLLQAQPPVPLAAVRVRRRHPAIDACPARRSGAVSLRTTMATKTSRLLCFSLVSSFAFTCLALYAPSKFKGLLFCVYAAPDARNPAGTRRTRVDAPAGGARSTRWPARRH